MLSRVGQAPLNVPRARTVLHRVRKTVSRVVFRTNAPSGQAEGDIKLSLLGPLLHEGKHDEQKSIANSACRLTLEHTAIHLIQTLPDERKHHGKRETLVGRVHDAEGVGLIQLGERRRRVTGIPGLKFGRRKRLFALLEPIFENVVVAIQKCPIPSLMRVVE